MDNNQSMNDSNEEEKVDADSPEPQQLEFSDAERTKSGDLLVDTFKIEVQGVVIAHNQQTNQYQIAAETVHKICIFVEPKRGDIQNKKDYDVDLRKCQELNHKIGTASAAKLAYIAVRGFVIPNLELEHVCHHHQCINPYHHNFATKSDNQKRKACFKKPDEIKLRNKGQFCKAQGGPRTHVPKEEIDWCHCRPKCIYNLAQVNASDWQIPEIKAIIKELVEACIPGVEMQPFW